MKKFAFTLVAVIATAVASFAADLSTVWNQVKSNASYIVADVSPADAREEGFEAMTVAVNSAPTTNQILDAKRLTATIDESQKLTSVSQEGVDVAIYASPATADGLLYNLLMLVAKGTGEDKALIFIYGKCSASQMASALQKMSLEKIIGS